MIGPAANAQAGEECAAVLRVAPYVAADGAVVQSDTVVFVRVAANLFGAGFLCRQIINVFDQIGRKFAGSASVFPIFVLLPCRFRVVFAVDAVAADFAADGGFVAVDVFGGLADGKFACGDGNIVSLFRGQLCVAHCAIFLVREGCMLPHTGLLAFESVALGRRM